MTKKLLLVTIGTSLLEKEILGKAERFDPTSLDEVFFMDFSCDKYKNNTYPSNNGDKISVFVKTAGLLNITNELEKREKDYKDYEYDPDRFPAEISSVLLYLQSERYFQYDGKTNTIIKNNNLEYDIRFLISDTPRCKFCAKAIQYYFNNKIKPGDKLFIPDGNLHIIDKLSENSVEFNNGLQKLLTTINEIAENADTYQEIVFNITAGYKGVVPYMVLAGMCYKNSRIIYLYETSKSIIEIPRLPVNFDIAGWNDNRSFLNVLTKIPNVGNIYSSPETLPLSEEFRSLFTQSGTSVSFTPFGNFLQGKYKKAKEEKALSEFGRGYILADLIQDSTKKNKLKKWINNSQNIWYGDNIPETVDHSRGHCQRLLELAAQIIKPINAVKGSPFFDNDDELIVLNLVLWFHDIGHSGREMIKGFNDDTVQGLLKGKTNGFEYVDISDFPTANRDLHHILGFIEALKDAETMEFYGFKDNGEDGYLPQGYLKAAIYAYLYHRKKMLEIKNGSKSFLYSPFNVEIKKTVPEEFTINVNGQKIIIPLRFIAALQAFVDECDNSRERTGDKEYNKRRKWQTNREIKTEYDKLQFIYKSLTCTAPFELILKIFQDGNNDFINYESLLKKSITLKQTLENNKTIEDFLNCLIKQSVNSNKLEFNEMSKTLNKLIFKLIQRDHFDKSHDIKSVFIQPDKGFSDSNYKFTIGMESDNQCLFKNDKFSAHQSVKEIKEQYCLIKDILCNKNIVFNKINLFDENGNNVCNVDLQ